MLVWLKDPADAQARAKLIETTESFRAIPGVQHVAIGKALPSTRPIVDSSFDLAFVMTFNDRAALDAYEKHPTHERAVKEVLTPLVRQVRVYDAVSE